MAIGMQLSSFRPILYYQMQSAVLCSQSTVLSSRVAV